MTPLHWAASHGHFNVVEYLVNQKADIKAKSINGDTPLSLADENGFSEIFEFLKSNGA